MSHSDPTPQPASPWDLDTLPGVNFEPVLALLGGDRAMLAELLGEFAAQYANLPAETASALATGDIDNLARQMHGLKGTAANLGLEVLSRQAATLEAALRQGQPTAEPLAALAACLDTLLPALRAASGHVSE